MKSPFHLEILSGPHTFTFFENVLGKKILLLGERHTTENICKDGKNVYEIHEWLHDLSEKTKECIDIMIESDFYSNIEKDTSPLRKLNTYESPLRAIRHMIQLHQNKTTTRYHNIDIRVVGKNIKDPLVRYIDLFDTSDPIQQAEIEMTNIFVNQKYYNMNYSLMLKYVLGLDMSKESKEMYFNYIRDLYAGVNISYNVSDIYKYISLFQFKINKELEKSTLNKNKFLETMFHIYYNLIQTRGSIHLLLIFLCIPMDLYTLSRIFIQFDPTKMKRGPELCKQTNELNTVIIYGGADHIEIYNMFLQLYFELEPSISIENNKAQCIEFASPFKLNF
jgi:hypothetical protein